MSFNTPGNTESSVFTFQARVVISESRPLSLIEQDVIESQTQKFDIERSECKVSRLQWAPKNIQTQGVPILSTLDIVIGPVHTDKNMEDLSNKVHVALTDHSISCIEVHNVKCIDIIP